MNLMYIFVTALFSALILVPFLCRWGLEYGKVDQPDERKVHSKAVPRLGGVAIFLAFLCTMLLYVEMSREVRGVLAGGVVIFLTGLLDDLQGLSARNKFIGQLCGCLLAATIGNLWIVHLGDLFGFGGNCADDLPHILHVLDRVILPGCFDARHLRRRVKVHADEFRLGIR